MDIIREYLTRSLIAPSLLRWILTGIAMFMDYGLEMKEQQRAANSAGYEMCLKGCYFF